MLSLMHLCEEAQAAVARLQTYLHKSLDSSANKSKIIKPMCITTLERDSSKLKAKHMYNGRHRMKDMN